MKLKPQILFNRKYHGQAIVLFLIVFQCAVLLSGCGFRLRGSDVVQKIDQVVYIQTNRSHSALIESLGDYLELTQNRDEAHVILTIINESKGRRVLSVARDGKVEEYELQYVVTFSATRNNKAAKESASILLPEQSVVLKRTYLFDESAVLAIEVEESALYEAMADDAARQITRRLGASMK